MSTRESSAGIDGAAAAGTRPDKGTVVQSISGAAAATGGNTAPVGASDAAAAEVKAGAAATGEGAGKAIETNTDRAVIAADYERRMGRPMPAPGEPHIVE